MTNTQNPLPERQTAAWLPGVILIVIGVALLATRFVPVDADVVVLVVGLLFAAAYAGRRAYGLLVAAGILTGLGAGIVLEDYQVIREPVVFALGLGFIAIYLADVLVDRERGIARWWPLIPGSTLTTVAIANGALGEPVPRALELAWPIILIVLGALLLYRRTSPTKTG